MESSLFTNNIDIFICSNLLNVTLHNNITVLFIQLDGIANSIGLLTGNQRRARTSKRIKHDAIGKAGVHNGVAIRAMGFMVG